MWRMPAPQGRKTYTGQNLGILGVNWAWTSHLGTTGSSEPLPNFFLVPCMWAPWAHLCLLSFCREPSTAPDTWKALSKGPWVSPWTAQHHIVVNSRLSERLAQRQLLLQTGCQIFSGFHYPGERNALFIFSLIIKSLSSFISERQPKPKGYVLKYLHSNSGWTNLY